MPQFQTITIGDKTFTPDEVSGVSAAAQDLSQVLGRRDRMVFDRNVGEGNGKPYRRVLRVQLQRDAGTDDNPVPYTLTGAFTLTFPAVATQADREEMMDLISGAFDNADIRTSFANPEWFY